MQRRAPGHLRVPAALVIAAAGCLAGPALSGPPVCRNDTPASPEPHERAVGSRGGCCPQTTIGWMRYADENPRVPSFWWEESVAVDELVICEHGVFFIFSGKEDGEARTIAFEVANPAPESYHPPRQRVAPWHAHPGDPAFDAALARDRARYRDLVVWLSAVEGRDLGSGARISFRERAPAQRPRILLRGLLELDWKGGSCLLRGSIDVFMTMTA